MGEDNMLKTITPDWDVPSCVKAFTTTVYGGSSLGNYASFNLGEHVGDDPDAVAENRTKLQSHVGERVRLCWLQQTHSDIVADLSQYQSVIEADAAITTEKHKACIVMTADCLPILLCNADGSKVAALHCGWKGLYQHLIAKTFSQYFVDETVTAWLGPAIGENSYEVDAQLYQRFINKNPSYSSAFVANRPGHYLLDLYTVARLQLTACGVSGVAIFGGNFDTLSDSRFFSYRRQNVTGRMATVIYFV